VVAAAHGGLPEIIEDGTTGLLFPPGDAAALARAARQLIDDPALAADLGARAAGQAQRRFAPERLIEAVLDLYAEVLRA
jgi:glycosyltransferase involved in cell wall biosynthesis